MIKLKRWSIALKHVAGASPRHAQETAIALQRTFRGDPKAPPHDELSLVALLIELLAQTGRKVDDVQAWTYLSTGKHKAKLAPFAPA